MERILILLEERNKYLTKFLIVTEDEEKKFIQGNFEGIDQFYEARESLLEMVQQIKKLVEKHLKLNTKESIPETLRHSVDVSLRLRDELIKRILDLDLGVLGLIENQKSQMLRELQAIGRGKKVVTKYHSGNVSKRLDEKA